MCIEDHEPPGYRNARRELEARRRRLAAHPDPMDPLCPEDSLEEIEEAERELDESLQ